MSTEQEQLGDETPRQHSPRSSLMGIEYSTYVLTATAVAVAVVTFIFGCTSAKAQTSIIVHGPSHHFTLHSSGRAWNEFNAGIGIRREFSADFSGQVGMYHNSLYRTSAYASVDYTPLHVGRFAAGGFAALATGYRSGVTPAGGALLRWQGDKASVAVRLVPKISSMKDDAPGMVSVEFGWRFWS